MYHSYSPTPKEVFIDMLLRNGVKPEIRLLESVNSGKHARSAERRFIREYGMKYNILNSTGTPYIGSDNRLDSPFGCGKSGFLCGRIHECEVCRYFELRKRRNVIIKLMSNVNRLYRGVVTDGTEWNRIRKKANRYGVEFIKIPLPDNNFLVFASEFIKTKPVKFFEVNTRDAIDEMCLDENLITDVLKNGRRRSRSSSKAWNLAA